MYYENFEKLCKERGVKPGAVGRAADVPSSALTAWKQGLYTPKIPRLKKIADYFGVSVGYLTGEDPKAEALQSAFDDTPEMRGLFDALDGATSEEIQAITDMIKVFRKQD